jgi:hypothetical protein
MESPIDCSTVDLPRNDNVLAVDGALLAKLVPTTETTNVDLTRDGEICRMNQVGFGAAVGIWLSNRFGRFACKGPELVPALDSGTSVDMLPVRSDIWIEGNCMES